MLKKDKEYRNKYAVAPQLDAIANQTEGKNVFPNISAPQPVYSKWCYSKSMSAHEKAGLKAVVDVIVTLASSGLRYGAGSPTSFLDGGNDGSAVSNMIKASSKDYMYYCAKLTGQYETIYWDRFYFLQFFEPAKCRLGENHVGRESANGYTAHFADNSGIYYEGYFFGDNFTGIRILPNGERFLGTLNLRSGFEGDCVFIKPNGDREYAKYSGGSRVSGIILSEKLVYEGEWRNGELNGQGFIMNETGSNFGEFRNGVLVG